MTSAWKRVLTGLGGMGGESDSAAEVLQPSSDTASTCYAGDVRVACLCVCGWVMASAASAQPTPTRADPPNTPSDAAFVRTGGDRFVVEGETFAFVGGNAAVMHGAAARAALGSTLDAMVQDGLRVVRIWALGEAPADAPEWKREFAFRLGPSGWVEASFEHLDAVLEAARARDLRVVVVLANRWADYGGFPEYTRWTRGQGASTGARPPDLTGNELDAFFVCDRCNEAYRAHVRRVVTRTNQRTGVAYRDDPTILAWELVNEISAFTQRGEQQLLEWVQSMSARIRSLDPNHLISAGHIGFRGSRGRQVWSRVCALPEVGYCDAHAYPSGDPRVTSPSVLRAWVSDQVHAWRTATAGAPKPFVFGEVGFALHGERAVRHPDQWMRAFLRASRALGASGVLAWVYGPTAPSPRPHLLTADATGAELRVRRALRRAARQAPVRRAVAPRRWTARHTLRGARVHAGWAVSESAPNQRSLTMSPAAFRRASFERTGHALGPPEHVWGHGAGVFEYAWRAPRAVWTGAVRIVVEAVLSSELPGVGDNDPADGSEVTVRWDGETIGTAMARSDDGRGALERFVVDDPQIVTRLLAGPRHRLSFHAGTSGAGGLCIYATQPIRIVVER